MAFYNTNLHPAFFQQRIPVFPDSKRRSVASVEEERYLPINLRNSYKGFKLYEESFKLPKQDYILKRTSRTPLTNLFFSQENIDELHKLIRYMVYDQSSGFIIEKQSDEDLLIVMRSMYLQYSTFPTSCDKEILQKEIDRLNVLTTRTIVPQIISEAKQFTQYLIDASQIPAPIPRALNVSNTGTRELRSVSSILSGRPNENLSLGFTQDLANQY